MLSTDEQTAAGGTKIWCHQIATKHWKTDLVVDDDVVFGCHVVGNVVVDNQPQKTVEKCQVDLLIELLEARLQHHVTLTLRCVPHVVKVVDS